MAQWWVTREGENISHPLEKENFLTQIHEFGKGRCDRFLSEGTSWSSSPWCYGVRAMDRFLKLPGFMASAWCAWSSAWRISLRRLGELLPVPWRLRVVAPLIFPTAATKRGHVCGCDFVWLEIQRCASEFSRFWQKGCRCSPRRKGENLQMPTVEHHPY